MQLVWFVIIGAIAGWLASHFMRGNAFGFIADVVIGIAGALGGSYLFRGTGSGPGNDMVGSVLFAFAGAVVLLFIVRILTSSRGGQVFPS